MSAGRDGAGDLGEVVIFVIAPVSAKGMTRPAATPRSGQTAPKM